MTPLPFVWPYALIFWAIFLWAFAPEYLIVKKAREGVTVAGSKDGGSLQMILIAMPIATLVAFPLAWVSALQFPAGMRIAVFVAGTAILIAGTLLRRHCFKQLGASFTGDVRARADQVVITSGAYAFLRHPSYAAGTLMNLGLGVALGSWMSALILAVISIAVYSYRMSVEERALVEAIGEPYREFMRTRRRMIPFVY